MVAVAVLTVHLLPPPALRLLPRGMLPFPPHGASGFLRKVAQTCRAGAGLIDGWAPEPLDDTNPTDALVAVTVPPTDLTGVRAGAGGEPAYAATADLTLPDDLLAGVGSPQRPVRPADVAGTAWGGV